MNQELFERIVKAKYNTSGDKELLKDINVSIETNKGIYKALKDEYAVCTDPAKKAELISQAKDIIKVHEFLKEARNAEVAKLARDEKYRVRTVSKEEPSRENTKKKSKFGVGVLTGALAVGIGALSIFGVKGCAKAINATSAVVATTPAAEPKSDTKVTDTPAPTATATPVVETVGNHYVTTKLTDVNDDEQVYARAQEIYDTYCVPYLNAMNESDRAQAMKKCNVDSIANIIRHKNGALTQNAKGEAEFGPNSIDDMVALQLSIFAQYPSIQEFGSQIFFVPLSTVFVDGFQEYLNQVQLDEKMEKVVEARRSENFEEFIARSQDWAYEYIEQFDRDNFNGQNNIYDINSMKYTYYTANDEQYICNIFEVIKGNKTSLCIDYCTEDGVYVKTPFVQVVDKVRTGQTDYVSLSAGTEEVNKGKRTTLPKQWYSIESDYFEALCDQYVNNGGTLVLK